ncbi:efflux RND transporter periplasmic adaptor subunit, partial [Hydrogenimonas sp.]
AAGQELAAAKERLATTRRLFEKGLASKQEVAAERMALAGVQARRNALAGQLRSLGLRPETLKKPTDTLTIRAHAPGTVSRLLVPLHTNIGSETPVAALTQKRGYYAVAYLGVEEAMKLPKTLEATLYLGGATHPCRLVTLLPRVDETTQRARALFAVEERAKLLLDAYGEMALALPPYRKHPAVKRSALTMWEGEWVVFVPNPEAHGHDGKAHEEADHEEHEDHEEHDGEEAADHDEHGHETPPWLPRVVRIVAREGDLVAVEGIAPGETYVSDGVWFVKSLLLKERLGGHGH